MSGLEDYANVFPDIAFGRGDGVLLMRLHTDGGPLVFSDRIHRDLAHAFTAINDDAENRVVILTGTGTAFCDRLDYASFLGHDASAHDWGHRIRHYGRRMIQALLDLELPVIGVVNGPALSHSELPLLSDVVLASEDAVFQDATHFLQGLPPGDGMHTLWTTLLGLNRGRHFLLTGQRITAREALALGVVGEVLPREALLERAWQLGRRWAQLPRTALAATRHTVTYEWKRLFAQQLNAGLLEEVYVASAAMGGGSPPCPPPEGVPGVVDLGAFAPL